MDQSKRDDLITGVNYRYKKMMKVFKFISLPFFFSIVIVGFSSCGGAQPSDRAISFEKNPPFKIKESYYQKWVAGTKKGGSGINIHLDFETIQPNVVIRDIYFQNNILEVKNSGATPMSYVAHLTRDLKNDIVMDIDPMKEAKNVPSKTFPFELKANEAVIGYLIAGEKKYFKIDNLVEKREIAYPQANPNH